MKLLELISAQSGQVIYIPVSAVNAVHEASLTNTLYLTGPTPTVLQAKTMIMVGDGVWLHVAEPVEWVTDKLRRCKESDGT